jgi:enhancer of polycomb-like protein
MDAEDEVWLLNNSKFGGSVASNAKKKPEGAKEGTISEQEKRTINKTITTNTQTTTQQTISLPSSFLEIMLDVMEKATAFDAIITLDQAEHLILQKLPQLYHMYPLNKSKAGVVTIRHVVNDVYQYWVSKRGKLKRPLLRRFWPVTSTDDTNPHLVFRPREKEKYKLRKKRQNDMDAYRKLKQLKQDFSQVRLLLGLVQQREELNRSLALLQKEWFEQKLYDAVDTSGLCRVSKELDRKSLNELVQIEKYFDVQDGGPGAGGSWRKKKSRRGSQQQGVEGSRATSRTTSPIPEGSAMHFGLPADVPSKTSIHPHRRPPGASVAGSGVGLGSEASKFPVIIAGQNNGEPAPSFLQPLSTRESYATTWEGSVPHVTTVIDGRPMPTFRFRHRPRIGRGGRVCIDRVPLPTNPNVAPNTFYRAGSAPSISLEPKERLLDLLPPDINKEKLTHRIEEICLSALKEDYDAAQANGPSNTAGAASITGLADGDENDGTAVVVTMKDWLDTDEQIWGEERFAIGPI